ncbi:hypothetical protein ACHQM5_005389 [Ranunculus cassubicifolius]
MPSDKQISARNAFLSTTGSAVAMAMLLKSFTKDLFPFNIHDLNRFMLSTLQKLCTHLCAEITMVIEEAKDLDANQLYSAAEIYLRSKSFTSSRRFKLSKTKKKADYVITPEKLDEMTDVFEGARFKWKRMSKDGKYDHSGQRSKTPSFELRFHKKHKDKVLNSYLPFIINQANDIEQETRVVKLYKLGGGNGDGSWNSIQLHHPVTFDKLAMDDAQKKMIMDDLDRFVKRKDFYRRVGKAWKRGYLLYGPPGTGKSSLVAAMANYLNFDIYDLELTSLRGNSDFRRLLVSTKNQSILVVEDMDCSVDFQNPMKMMQKIAVVGEGKQIDFQQMTLSGMLNFMDGLWSSCGDERIIIVTTNNKDRLNPALLRPGRMDVHIHMSYCTPCGFRLLANNYLMVTDHPAFEEIEKLMEITNVTPAEVAETFMVSENPDVALEGLARLLNEKHLGAI